MFKSIKAYLKKRRERKLRERIIFMILNNNDGFCPDSLNRIIRYICDGN